MGLTPDKLATAFEHSITWEDDLWRADPVDVESVHAKARAKFFGLLDAVTEGRSSGRQARILLFHGQSGAGKTHLIRALRTGAHDAGSAQREADGQRGALEHRAARNPGGLEGSVHVSLPARRA